MKSSSVCNHTVRRVINKIRRPHSLSLFHHKYDYRLNCMTQSPVTKIIIITITISENKWLRQINKVPVERENLKKFEMFQA